MHSEDSETKLKLFVWPTNDGISMVGGTGVPFDPTSTARICFRGHNLVEHTLYECLEAYLLAPS